MLVIIKSAHTYGEVGILVGVGNRGGGGVHKGPVGPQLCVLLLFSPLRFPSFLLLSLLSKHDLSGPSVPESEPLGLVLVGSRSGSRTVELNHFLYKFKIKIENQIQIKEDANLVESNSD